MTGDGHDPAFPAAHVRCPGCGVAGYALLERRPCAPGLAAWWPDPEAAHWRRECRSCGHVWREPARPDSNRRNTQLDYGGTRHRWSTLGDQPRPVGRPTPSTPARPRPPPPCTTEEAPPVTAPPATAPRAGTRHIQLHLKRLDTGQVRVSTPQAREWAAVVRGPEQLWRAVVLAFQEASRAGEAAWLGDPDPDGARPTRPAVAREGVSWSKTAAARPDVAATEDWLPLPDGSWLSPSDKRYRSPRIIGPVIARRAALGLPTTYEAAAARAREVAVAAAEAPEAARFWERVEAAERVSRWHTSDRRNRQAAS